MLEKKVKNYAIAAAVFLLIYGALMLYSYLQRPEQYTAEDIGLPVDSLQNAVAVTINDIELEKKGNEWSVSGFDADSEKVANFLDAIKEIKIEAMLGTVGDRAAEFHLDERNRIVLEIKFADGTTYTAYFGKIGPTLHSRYMQPAGDERAFLVSGGFIDDLTDTLTDWRQKKLLYPVSDLTNLTVESTASLYSVALSDSSITIDMEEGSYAVGENDRERFKLMLEGVRADEFIDTPPSTLSALLEQPAVVMTASYSDGTEVEITGVPYDNDRYAFRRDDKSWIYLVPYYNVETLLADPREEYAVEQVK